MTTSLPPAALADLLDPWLDARHKGYPHDAPPLRRSQIGAQGWDLLAGDLPLPLAVIRRDALAHNLGWLQRYADDQGVALAPHGKTTMSPQLFARQLDAGAWGLTVAHVTQLDIARAAGARRCLIANQVVQDNDLAHLAALRRSDPGLRTMFLLDSQQQLALIEAYAARHAGTPPFEVLLEIGVPGGRCGCRDEEQALALARAARASAAVRLVGLECYEGLGASADDAADRAYADALMARVHAVARGCDDEALFELRDDEAVVLSAGGSAIFDLVVPALRLVLSRPVQGVLRSGCYVTHDQGNYRRFAARFNARLGCTEAAGLQAALEVWALVQSLPEPGLAILNAGRRDVSYDLALPTPLALARRGRRGAAALEPAPADWRITGLNDQHAYLKFDADAGLQVGDRVALGISHPCTTFDKWRWLPLVDADYRVVDAVGTCF